MGIISKVHQEELEYLQLGDFISILNFSLSGSGFSGFYLLPKLLDKGLSLWYTKSGYVSDEQIAFKGDIKCALTRLENKLFDTEEPESKLYKDEKLKTQDGLEISLGNLFVKRSDVKKAYSKYGEIQYPWALVLWPQNSDDWSWFPIVEKVVISKTKDTSDKSDSDFDKRLVVLKAWLIKENLYLDDAITTLPKEFTYNKVHTALNDESSDKSLFDLTLESFKRHFWQRQKIAKLKSGR